MSQGNKRNRQSSKIFKKSFGSTFHPAPRSCAADGHRHGSFLSSASGSALNHWVRLPAGPEKAAKQSAGGARSNPHTHLAPLHLFRHSVTSVTGNSERFLETNAKPLAPPGFSLAMGAMRSSINVCQKIVKTKYYPNCSNMRNWVPCLPARASSLSAGKKCHRHFTFF